VPHSFAPSANEWETTNVTGVRPPAPRPRWRTGGWLSTVRRWFS